MWTVSEKSGVQRRVLQSDQCQLTTDFSDIAFWNLLEFLLLIGEIMSAIQ